MDRILAYIEHVANEEVDYADGDENGGPEAWFQDNEHADEHYYDGKKDESDHEDGKIADSEPTAKRQRLYRWSKNLYKDSR